MGTTEKEMEDFQNKHGGYWDEHPDHLVGDWKYEVANSDTRQGYWEWVLGRIDAEGGDIEKSTTTS